MASNPFLDALQTNKPASGTDGVDNPFITALGKSSAVPIISPSVRPPAAKQPSKFGANALGAVKADLNVLKPAAKFVGKETKFAVLHPVTAAKNILKGLTSSEQSLAQGLAAPLSAKIIEKSNTDIQQKQAVENQIMLAKIRKEENPSKKQALMKIFEESQPTLAKVMDEIPALNKTPVQVIGDATGVLMDMLTLSGGLASKTTKSFALEGLAKNATKSILVETIKEPLFKSLIKTAGIGSLYGAVNAVQQGETSIKGIGKQAAVGALFGAALDVGLKGVGATFGMMVKAVKPVYQNYVVASFEKKFDAELVANMAKSPVLTTSLEDSFKHLGEDMKGLKKDGTLGDPVKETNHAVKLVTGKMSAEMKAELTAELKKGMPEGKPVGQGFTDTITKILQDPKARELFPKLSRYVDSVLGVINPAIQDVVKEVDALPGKVSQAAATRNQPENTQLNIEVRPGTKNFQQFDAAGGKSIITLDPNSSTASKWHEIAHALDRQNPELRKALGAEVKRAVGVIKGRNVTNENFADAMKMIAGDPSLRAKFPKITSVMDKVPQDVIAQMKMAAPSVETPPTTEVKPTKFVKGETKPTDTTVKPSVGAKPADQGFTTSKYYEGTDKFKRKINPQKINSVQDVIQLSQDIASKYVKFFQDVKGGTKPNAVTLAQAEELGLTVAQIKEIPQGSLLNAAQTAAVNQVKADLTLKLAEETRAISGKPTEADLVKLNGLVSQILQVDAVNKVSETELGRSIQIKKAIPIPREFDESIMEKLQKWEVVNAKDVKGAVGIAKNIVRDATPSDVFYNIYYNSILSGTGTQSKIIIHTGLNTLVNQVIEGITHPGNIKNQVRALVQGIGEGTKAFGEIMRGEVKGKNQFDYTEVLTPKPGASGFSKATLPVVKFISEKLNYVGRLITAEHTFFRAMNKNASLSSLAYEAARAEQKGGSKIPLEDIYQKHLANPTPDMIDQSVKEAKRTTFNTDKPEGAVGKIAEGMAKISNIDLSGKLGLGIKPFKFVIPFTRVAANILNAGIDYTVGGLVSITSRDMVLSPFARREISQQVAKAALGTAGMAFAYNLAKNGLITGSGSSSANVRKTLQAQGWKANSILIGGKYIPYTSFGGFAIPLAIAANLAEAEQSGSLAQKDLLGKMSFALLGTAKTVMDISFFSNIGALFQAIQNNTGSYLSSYFAGAATSVVAPQLLREIGSFFQHTQKSPITFSDIVKNDFGGLFNQNVPDTLDVFGQPVPTDRSGTATALKVFGGITVNANTTGDLKPVVSHISDLNLGLEIPTKQTTIQYSSDAKSHKMNDSELFQYKKIFGANLQQALTDDSANILSITDHDALALELRSIETQATLDSKDQFLQQFDK